MKKRYLRSISALVAISFFCLPFRGYALPEGEQVVSGTASFDRSQANTLNINQSTNKLITNYNGFSIGKLEAVNFIQPSSSSIALNRVVGVDPSTILGTMTANGKIFLINPNGVLFGQGCRIDTAGMVASTLNIADSDFLAGRYTFFGAGGSILNQGYISSPGGYVALLGSAVENSGMIEANLGSIVLASGNKMTLNLDPLGMISVAIDEATIANTENKDSAVKNTGTLKADAGKVVLTAKTLDGIFNKAVNNEGVIEAKSTLVDKAYILKFSQDEVLDELSAMTDEQILGLSKGEVLLLAEGENDLASNTGTIDVSSKESGVDGGFVEISGPRVQVAGNIDASSLDSAAGALLIDPDNIIIKEGGASDGLSGSTVGKLWLENCNFDVTIQADDSVIFDLYQSNKLDLKYFDTETFAIFAGKNISLNNSAVLTHGGNIRLFADYDHLPNVVGEINLGTGAGLQTSGGDVELNADNIIVSAPIKTSGGDVYIKTWEHDVTHTAQGDVETSGGDFVGDSGQNYELRNDASISTGSGRLEIKAGEDIILGSDENQVERTFRWQYLSGDRSYSFKVLGYYYKLNNTLIYVPLAEGCDIGKDGSTVLSGSGFLPDDVIDVDLYTVFKPSCGSTLSWYETQNMNADKYNHVKISGNTYSWEDMCKLGDADFNDAVIDFSIDSRSYAPGAFLSSSKLIDLTAGNSIKQSAGTITLEQSGLMQPVIISSNPDKETWTNDNTIEISWIMVPQSEAAFKAVAGNAFVMTNGAEINTNGGSASVTADRDISLTLIDAGDGSVTLNSIHGSIRDNDLGIVDSTGKWPRQNDYDIIAADIEMNAPEGRVGGCGTGEQIDLGDPGASNSNDYGFSYVWDESETTNPDLMLDDYEAVLDEDGNWVYSTTSPALADGIDWMFHLIAVRDGQQSTALHYGKFFIDTTAPVISAGLPQGIAGNNGWFLSDVTVNFSATDNLSGFSPDGALATDLASKTTSGEGTGLVVTSDGVYDRAGNFAAGIDAGPFKVDQTAPVITGAADRPANENGWYNADVTVNYAVKDALSGIDDANVLTDYDPDVLSDNAMGQSATGTVYDIAGNAASFTVAGINIDKIAPVIIAGSPTGTAGNNGWWLSDVTVPFSATDNLSGFSNGLLNTDLASKATTGEGTDLRVTSDGVSDLAGNAAVVIEAGPFKVDMTAPVITAGEPTGTKGNLDWWLSDVTVPFGATDNLSGFSPDGALATDLASKTTSGEGIDLVVTSDGVYDQAGNFAAGINAGSFKVDQTVPVITAGSPTGTAGNNGWWRSDVTVSFSATDNLSGVSPSGDLSADLASKMTSGEGIDLTVTSDGVYDVAGNFAAGIDAGPFKVDMTAPIISATVKDADGAATSKNENGWYNDVNGVTYYYDVNADISGLDTEASEVGNDVFDFETAGSTAYAKAVDLAGNEAEYGDNVKIDWTAPVITAGTPTGTKGNLDWWLSDVTVPFSATDNLSGFSNGLLDAVLASQTTSGEGVDLKVTSEGITDLAGNAAVVIDAGPFKVDQTAPVITAGTPTGTKGNLDWWLSDVTVPFSATDNLSGVSPSGDLSADLASKSTSGEGTDLTVTSDGVYDVAGNFAAGIDAGPYKVDMTAPEITGAADRPANENGWYNKDVTVSYAVNDKLSGIDDGNPLTDYDPDLLSDNAMGQSATGVVYDIAGNSASFTVAGINIDKIAPVILAGAPTGTAGNNGWWLSDVTVPFSATDNLSGFSNGLLNTDLAAQTTAGEGTDLRVTSGSVSDLAGNAAVIIEAGPFKVDMTAPVITAGTPTGTKNSDGEWVSAVTVPFSATDNLSGLVPDGALAADLASKTTPDSGSGLIVTSDGIYDMAGNFAAGIPAGPFDIFAPAETAVDFPLLANEKKLRVYYEILNPHRFVSFEPATPTTYYAYHPLTPTDSSAFDQIKLDINAYEFIQQNINLNKPLLPYFGENDLSQKKGF